MVVTVKRDNRGRFVSISKPGKESGKGKRKTKKEIREKQKEQKQKQKQKEKKERKEQKEKRMKQKRRRTKNKPIDEEENVKMTTVNNVVYGRIHADWCGHCTAMKNDWDQLQKMHPDKTCCDIEEKEQDIQVPLFNKTYSPVPPLQQAAGFPFIFKFEGNTKQVIPYNGARDINSMNQWLRNG